MKQSNVKRGMRFVMQRIRVVFTFAVHFMANDDLGSNKIMCRRDCVCVCVCWCVITAGEKLFLCVMWF